MTWPRSFRYYQSLHDKQSSCAKIIEFSNLGSQLREARCVHGPSAKLVHVVDETLYIDLRALNGDGVHPQAAGQRLFLSVLQGYDEDRLDTEIANLRDFGRHIALLRKSLSFHTWQLQIWDWQHSTTSNCFLSGDLIPIDLCFFGNNRLLVVGDTLKLYLIEDVSQMPQFLACFLIPIPVTRLFLPTEPQILAQQTYTSNPEHQLLCMTTFEDRIKRQFRLYHLHKDFLRSRRIGSSNANTVESLGPFKYSYFQAQLRREISP
ncbi:hypothetical protein DFJ58DRAFT_244014 [Suillus subalutaceus]|uniref:uncharacterized protein n=1 Tax=Suillus subalutaceus TaxID=48586 RepID=UPI001B873DE1|nr:uncharacterized protein DFJ58DRAFT_244014 [Suillus subalutaceus]KAG1831912.1 hypothetical protein DFJ58DRAFT_244014 [Suillus subalutaceus]